MKSMQWFLIGVIGGFVAAADRRYRRRALERAARALPGGQPA